MVETRRGTNTDAVTKKPTTANTKQAVNSTPAKVVLKASPATNTSGRKRKQQLSEDDGSVEQKKQKVGKKSASVKNSSKKETKEDVDTNKPRLTTPELEFDYDRSKLRDPRETPGRKRRPRYEELDIPADLKADLLKRFHIPEPEKPKGRLNWMQKDKLFGQKSLLDPMQCFHGLEVCHRKGRQGSPTYDCAGFELDHEKVADWKQPRAFDKRTVLNQSRKSADKMAREDAEMCEIFFEGGTESSGELPPFMMMNILKDHVSKDLGVPWHQIGPKELRKWKTQGFEKKRYRDWWHEPNEEENKRIFKMMSGAALRKHY